MESSFDSYYVECMAVWLMLQCFSFLSSFKDYVGICKDTQNSIIMFYHLGERAAHF